MESKINKITKELIYFNSRKLIYKKPFGAIAQDMNELTLRISSKSDEVTNAIVEFIDINGEAFLFKMKKEFTFENKDFFEVKINKFFFNCIGIWKYKFILNNEYDRVEYGKSIENNDGTGICIDREANYFDLIVFKKGFKTPDWLKDGVIYQIYVDRFFDGNKENNKENFISNIYKKNTYFEESLKSEMIKKNLDGEWSDPFYNSYNIFFGGDLQGVEKKLNYLKDLGVNILYLNPIVWSNSNHKYDAIDYKCLDPYFTMPIFDEDNKNIDILKTRKFSEKVFMNFINEATSKGFKVILDGVFNHVGEDSIYFDKYNKYHQIGAYQFWSKVFDKVNNEQIDKNDAIQQVIKFYTNQKNPLTKSNYKYPEDFEFINWFSIKNQKINNSKDYLYECWYRHTTLPVIDSVLPEDGDKESIEGYHQWNNVKFREHVLGCDLRNLPEDKKKSYINKSAAQKWIWMGAKGWRIDAVPDISKGTLKQFYKSLKSLEGIKDYKKNCIEDIVCVAELWPLKPEYFLGDMFDSVINYKFKEALEQFLIYGDGLLLHNALETIRESYPEEVWRCALNLIGSHDTMRAATKYRDLKNNNDENIEIFSKPGIIVSEASKNELEDLRLAMIFQMGYPGSPLIYYGDEVGLEGKNDPDNRRPFPWDRILQNNNTYNAKNKYSIVYDTLKKSIEIRKKYKVFRYGLIKLLVADFDVIVYGLKYKNNYGILAINRSDFIFEKKIKTNYFFPEGLNLYDLLREEQKFLVKNDEINFIIPPKFGLLMVDNKENKKIIPKIEKVMAKEGDSKIELKWETVDGVQGYNIYKSKVPFVLGDKHCFKIATLKQYEKNFIDFDVKNGVNYFYCITAIDGENESLDYGIINAIPIIKIDKIKVKSFILNKISNNLYNLCIKINLNNVINKKNKEKILIKLKYISEKKKKDKILFLNLIEDNIMIYTENVIIDDNKFEYIVELSIDDGKKFYELEKFNFKQLNNNISRQSPISIKSKSEKNRISLKWESCNDDVYGFEIYRRTGKEKLSMIAKLSKNEVSFDDFNISYNTEYHYVIAIITNNFEYKYSKEISVKSYNSLVDVILRVNLPYYTPKNDNIFIRLESNNFNNKSCKITRINNFLCEYKFKALPGTKLEYSFSRGSCHNIGLTSLNRISNDVNEKANWAYYDFIEPNMNLIVSNKNNNSMVIEDYIIRWLDIPLVMYQPILSTEENTYYKTNSDKIDLKFNVPFDTELKIEGEHVNRTLNDIYGDININNIPLEKGCNCFTISIQRSRKILKHSWFKQRSSSNQYIKRTMFLKIERI